MNLAGERIDSNQLIPKHGHSFLQASPALWACLPHQGWECAIAPNWVLSIGVDTIVRFTSASHFCHQLQKSAHMYWPLCLNRLLSRVCLLTWERTRLKLEHRKFQSGVSKQVLPHEGGQTLGQRTKKAEVSPALERFRLQLDMVLSQEMYKRSPDIPSDPRVKSLFLNNHTRFQWAAVWVWIHCLLSQAALQGKNYLPVWVWAISQPGPQGPVSIPIIITKWKEKKLSIASHSCDFFFYSKL